MAEAETPPSVLDGPPRGERIGPAHRAEKQRGKIISRRNVLMALGGLALF